ncbi:MAG: FHA domain-containing protein [Actinomycetota bacterium]|nr:FHA domain-containing protein [Actinomycetota bacterium]MDQ6945723.1 FHA domain-containing protein [Actinomycetota bacterium]
MTGLGRPSWPAGTVTFLFTDIEGSTRLLRRMGDAYLGVLERHRQLIRTAVADNGGVEVDAEGDGFLFAFASAKAALTACITAQLELQAERWPEDAMVAVRMGLHTGEAAPLDGHYVALALHQASRVVGLAYGGQVIASEATAATLWEALPASTSLTDLGAFRLKDFDKPTRVYQICHPKLRSNFPPPRVHPGDNQDPSTEVSTAEVVATSYRAPAAPSGYFRVPGEMHVHIDGARHISKVYKLVKDLSEPTDGRRSFAGKFNRITGFAGGPQRDDTSFAQTYRHHTPGTANKERFDSFSTTRLGEGEALGPDAVAALARILGSVSSQPGAVVELERVMAVLEPNTGWTEADPPWIADPVPLVAPEVGGFRRLMTSPIEIHHSIDLPKTILSGEDSPPISIQQLPVWPNLGGWFLFDKGTSWSYRSSEFAARADEYHYAASFGQQRLVAYLAQLGYSYTLHTLVEQVLGVWRGGEQPNDERLPVSALSEWEMSCPPNAHFWVIAGNFLGDRSPDVRRAMIQNLAQNVTYTYFLHTHADVLRLGLLVEDLQRELLASGAPVYKVRQQVADNVRCVLLPPDLDVAEPLRRLLESDSFVCPYDEQMGGYRLDPSGVSGDRMAPEDYHNTVVALVPLLNTGLRGLFMTSAEAWTRTSSSQAVVCTDLEETAVFKDHDPWLKMLAAYDRIVAREVSMHGCDCLVVRPIRNGYLLVFRQPKDAAAWSRRLQFEVQRHNQEVAKDTGRDLPIPEQNMALGYGPLSRVLRAHGFDYVGGVIDDCIDLAAKLSSGLLAMSRAFADQYQGRVGTAEFQASTKEFEHPTLGTLRLLAWPRAAPPVSLKHPKPSRDHGVPANWEAIVEADRSFYEHDASNEDIPFPASWTPRVFELTEPRILIGRRRSGLDIAPKIDLSGDPEDTAISRGHAALDRQDDGSYSLVDFGSTNGTFLNDMTKPVEAGTPIPLRHGDCIYVGAWTRIAIRAPSPTATG